MISLSLLTVSIALMAQIMPPDVTNKVAMAIAPKPKVFKLKLGWLYPNTPPTNGFYLSYGGAPGQPTNSIRTGTSNSFTLLKTNWTEQGARHWYTVAAGTNGLPSNEIFYPPYPDDHILVSWKSNTLTKVLATSDPSRPRSTWTVLSTGIGTSFADQMSEDRQFYAIDRNEKLTVKTFNPLNK